MNFLEPPIFHSATSSFFPPTISPFCFLCLSTGLYKYSDLGDTHTHTHTYTGHTLTLKQEDIGIKGWAVEARVYAEIHITEIHSTRQLGHLSLKSATILPFSSSLSPSLLHSTITSLSFSYPLISSFPCFFSYPQDPVHFLPSIGYLSTYREPTGRPGLEKV